MPTLIRIDVATSCCSAERPMTGMGTCGSGRNPLARQERGLDSGTTFPKNGTGGLFRGKAFSTSS